MQSFFGVLSFIVIFGVTFPYIRDILNLKAKPSRSTRLLFFVLMSTTLVIQSRDFTSWVLALTVAEVASQILLLGLSFKYGLGGLQRLDVISYVLFTIALTGYLVTGETLVGLALLCLTDLVAFVPTIVKNFKDPKSDTPLFFFMGVVGGVFSVLAADDLTDINEILVPGYIAVINLFPLLPLISEPLRKKFVSS